MTSAPIQASIIVHDGPASNCVRSTTRTPASALSMAAPLCLMSLARTLSPHPSCLERILPRCCIHKPRRVLGQEQACLQQLAHDLTHPLHISRVAAVALFQGGTWVTLGQALGFCLGKEQTHALTVAEFSLEPWDVVEIPAGVGRHRHGDGRQAHSGNLISIRVDL